MALLPFRNFAGVEISAGIVQSETVTGATGTRPILTNVGRRLYFVDVIEPDGGRIGMWEGDSHAEAVRQANLLAIDFGGKVRDRTGCEA